MRSCTTILALFLLTGLFAVAQQSATPPMTPPPAAAPSTSAEHGIISNMADAKFMNLPGIPQCASGAVEKGDPMAGTFVLLIKTADRCVVPMHWHTANEQLMIVDGTGVVQMRGEQPQRISNGGYAYMPARGIHQFTCEGNCVFHLSSDGAFDIHYVDQNGNELSPDRALSLVGERTVSAMPK